MENDDLNEYIVPKVYRCAIGRIKATLKNLPAEFKENVGFRLTVKQIAACDMQYNNTVCIQIIEPNLPDVPVYRRYYYGCNSTRWGAWHRIMTNIDLENRLNNKDLEITGNPDTSISILGICVLRDIFGMRENDGGYNIERNVSFINPIAMMGDASICDCETISSQVDKLDDNNFVKRNIYLDLTKKYWEYLAEVQSDYIMIDVADIRLPILLDENGCSVTCRFQNKPLMERLSEQNVYQISHERRVCDYTDEEIQVAMEYLAEKVQELYPQNKIILTECIPSEHYYNVHGDILRFDVARDVENCKKIVKKAYAIIHRLLPDANVVPMPKYIMADAKHKWSLYMLHYEKAYYDYAYQAVRIITGKLPNKEQKIQRLKSAVEDSALRRITEKMIDKFGCMEDFFKKMNVDSLVVPTWASIKADECLDQYFAPATYRCVDGATKATLKMLPEKFTENVGFRLTVKNISANGASREETSCIQILEPNYPNCAIYRRYHYGGKNPKWGPWLRLSTDADLEALTQTSTAQAEQITKLTEQLSAQTKTGNEQADRITKLTEQLSAQTKTGNEQAEKITKLNEQLSAQTKSNTAQAEKITKLTEQLSAQAQTNTEQAEQITQLNEQLSAQAQTNTEQAEQITQLNEQIETMQNEMAAQKKLLEALAKVVLR